MIAPVPVHCFSITFCKFPQMLSALFAQPMGAVGLFMAYLLYQSKTGLQVTDPGVVHDGGPTKQAFG